MPLLVEVDRELRQVFSSGEGDGRDILHKLLQTPGRISGMSEGMVRGLLRMSGTGEVPYVPDNGRSG